MPRNPLGVYVRQTSDWFIKRCATVGGYYNSNTQNSIIYDLFNDASDGSNLHVYKIWLNNQGNDISLFQDVTGHAPNFMAKSSPVVMGQAQLPGTMYYDLTAPQPILFNTPVGGRFVYDDVDAEWQELGVPGPLVVIPPGYSLRTSVIWPSTISVGGPTFSVSYFFAVLPDQG